MDNANYDTDEKLFERGTVPRAEANELLRIAAIIREEAQKLTHQAERGAQLLAANNAGRVK